MLLVILNTLHDNKSLANLKFTSDVSNVRQHIILLRTDMTFLSDKGNKLQ